jgi:N-acetylglutamate synthase-like GNAT family acetyltransferase
MYGDFVCPCNDKIRFRSMGPQLMGTVEQQHDSYTISDDPSRLELNEIWDFMDWGHSPKNMSIGTLERALANSVYIGAYSSVGNQVGLLRLVTDFATLCFLTDLFVHVDHRQQGLSKIMISVALSHPRLQGVSRWNVIAPDAQELFASAGFSPITRPEQHMERVRSAGQKVRGISKTNDKEFCRGYN